MTLMSDLIKNTSPSTFKKGEALFKQGKFNPENYIKVDDGNIHKYYNSYAGTVGTYHQALIINDEEIEDLTCSCPAFFEFGGYCKHCVAMVFSLLNDNTNEEKSKDFYNLIEKKEYIQSRIIPYISRYRDDFYLYLKIDIGKEYIIRNISDFIECVRNEYTMYLGKNEYNPNIKYFDDLSKELIYLLMDFEYAQKEVRIQDTVFDRIFDIYKGNYINLSINKLNKIYLSEEIYTINLKLEDSNLIMDDLFIIKGFKNNYVLIDDKLYRINNIDDSVKKLYRALFNKKSLSIKGYEKQFFKKFYPHMESVNVPYEVICKYQNEIINIDTYLEYDGVIKLTTKFFINGNITESLDEDEEKYIEYKEYTNELGFINNEIIDIDDIADFLTKDISRFKDFGLLFIADSLNNLNVVKPPKLDVNVRYKVDLLEIDIKNDELTNEEISKILSAYKKKKRFIKFKGNILDIRNSEYLDLLTNLNIDHKNVLGNHEIEGYNIFKLKNYASKDILEIIDSFNNLKSLNYPINELIKDNLREYQKIGFNWLNLLSTYHLGGVLADDMGLGKTLQIISLIESDKSNKSSIIVCPTSLIYNWQKEVLKWGFNNCVVISGSYSERLEMINNIKDNYIYVTSYDSLRRDIDNYNYKFRFIVADEAQFIKNNQALKTKAIKKLQSEVRYALTGTPIENRLMDLWSIFDFILPNYLSSYDSFKKNYEQPIFLGDKDLLKILIKKITPFVLRRCKKDVLKELPPKIEEVIYVNMADDHRRLYNAYYLNALNQISSMDSKIEILSLLTRLRQICVEPRMFLEDYNGSSSKLEMAISIINEAISNGHKILLFSQFSSSFEYISERLNEQSIGFDIIKGDTKANKRLEIVDKFNNTSDLKVLLISLKAGGTGLNLIGADMVIHFDPWWNISAENQATDRTHRIGQKRCVSVIKLICSNTIEQRVLELQNQKKELSESVISDDLNSTVKLSKSDIKYLLG